MSKYFSIKDSSLVPYTPGEQPKDTKYLKLNTNESPFEPSEKALKYVQNAFSSLNLYSDPECTFLKEKMAEILGVNKDNIIFTNGSDEVLYFAFMAFCDKDAPAVFPDITYGFYKVFADVNGIPFEEIPLGDDLSININDYLNINKTIFIANPNAPTGIALSLEQIEKIVSSNLSNVVVIDEAYVDFSGESAIKLTEKYDNLLVTGTFSKSRSAAGARLGFAVGSKALIADLNTIKYSTNPYNINSLTMALGLGILSDEEYTLNNCKKIIINREFTSEKLKELGFELTESSANFIFARHSQISGENLYLKLKQKGILVRHFPSDRIKDYVRITIGTKEQMLILIENIKKILEEEK